MRHWRGNGVVAVLSLGIATLVVIASAGAQNQRDPNAANSFEPPASYTKGVQLKSHLERLQRVPLTQRQGSYSEQYVKTADRILEDNPPESLREFAVVNLLDGLQHWADADKNADAEKRLAETAEKYKSDSNKRIATTASFYVLEQRVLNPDGISPEDVGKTLDEVKASLAGKSLNAKFVRIANGTNVLINYLGTDEEAEKRFKEFSRVFAASSDQNISKLGNSMKTAKRDPALRKSPATAAVATTNEAVPVAGGEKPAPVEAADKWLARMEAKLPNLSGSENDAEYEREKSAFLNAYPNEPTRWQWYIMDARRAVNNPDRAQGIGAAKGALAMPLASPDVPANVRELASMMLARLEVASPSSETEAIRVVSEHIKNYPKSALNASLATGLAQVVTRGRSEEDGLSVLELLKTSGVPLLESAATARAEILDRLIKLKTSPLDLKFKTVDGKDFDIAKYRGKVVVIDFWATWCGPCVAELPKVIELYKKLHDQGFEIVGISLDQDKQALEQFVKEKEMPWVQFFDGKAWENKYAQLYGIQSIPAMWLVGRDGNVVDFNAREGLETKIEAQMQQQ
jgi:thiol-disulfide isomerase/thioredoxin